MVFFSTALLTSALTLAGTQLALVHGWWDNGHMLVGEVASQLISDWDRQVLESLLTEWEGEFPNTNRVATAAIWPDLIKCSKPAPFCPSPLLPSISMMEEWHYIDLPINVNGSKWLGKDANLELFKFSLGGKAVDLLEKTMQTFNTTRSIWAGNFMLRNFIHVFGDVHQPFHALGGVSEKFPKGDAGGNLYKFASPCPFANLHALWDAAGGLYVNNWAPEMDFEDQLWLNATKLALESEEIEDPLEVENLMELPFQDFARELVNNKLLQKIVLGAYETAQMGVYTKLDLTVDKDGNVRCPSNEYMQWAQEISRTQIALAGRRLAIVLTQLARQISLEPES